MTDWPDMSNFLTHYCESDVDAANRMNAAMKQWVEELINLRQEWMPEISTYLREAARVHSEQHAVLDKYK